MCFTFCAGQLSWLGCRIPTFHAEGGGRPCEHCGSHAAGRNCTGAKEMQPCLQCTLSHLVQLTEEVKHFAYPCGIEPLVAFRAEKLEGCWAGMLSWRAGCDPQVGHEGGMCRSCNHRLLPAQLLLPRARVCPPLLLGDLHMNPNGKAMGHGLQVLEPQGLLIPSKNLPSLVVFLMNGHFDLK